MEDEFSVVPVGRVLSPVTRVEDAVRQGDEGAPACTIELRPDVAAAAADLREGDALVVLTWLHEADRGTLAVHPRDNAGRPLTGVFSTRSSDRPNPIGLHAVRVLEVGPDRLRVDGLEAIDGTPVLDIKPDLGPLPAR